MSETRSVYLGDAVYAKIDADGILKLWTSDGYGQNNIIFLEPATWDNLMTFVAAQEKLPPTSELRPGI